MGAAAIEFDQHHTIRWYGTWATLHYDAILINNIYALHVLCRLFTDCFIVL